MEIYLNIRKQYRRIYNIYTSKKFILLISSINLTFLFLSVWKVFYNKHSILIVFLILIYI